MLQAALDGISFGCIRIWRDQDIKTDSGGPDRTGRGHGTEFSSEGVQEGLRAWVFLIVHGSYIPHLTVRLYNSTNGKETSLVLQQLLGKLDQMVEQEVEVGVSHILIESQRVYGDPCCPP